MGQAQGGGDDPAQVAAPAVQHRLAPAMLDHLHQVGAAVDLAQRRGQPLARGVVSRQPGHGQFHMPAHGREQVVELVGDAGSQGFQSVEPALLHLSIDLAAPLMHILQGQSHYPFDASLGGGEVNPAGVPRVVHQPELQFHRVSVGHPVQGLLEQIAVLGVGQVGQVIQVQPQIRRPVAEQLTQSQTLPFHRARVQMQKPQRLPAGTRDHAVKIAVFLGFGVGHGETDKTLRKQDRKSIKRKCWQHSGAISRV